MTTTNITKEFFGDETLNRVSFLRGDADYITQTISFSDTTFIFYVKNKAQIEPLSSTGSEEQLVIRQHKQLPPHFQKLLKEWGQANEAKSSDLLCLGFKVVFLGIDEIDSIVGQGMKKFNYKDKYNGVPVYAILLNEEILTSLQFSPNTTTSLSNMMDFLNLPNHMASLASYGKMYLDWLSKYNFCPGCASAMIPVDAGTRLLCLSDLSTKNCPVKSASVNNVCFPRTDAVVITCATNLTGDKILLGWNKRHRFHKMYSCISGFMEPSETIEMAAVREIWEETGCRVASLKIHSSQPWPFPVNLMIGCIAVVDFNGINEKIDLGHDNELEDARWFDIEELRNLATGGKHPEGIKIPMSQSIAFSLINAVINKNY